MSPAAEYYSGVIFQIHMLGMAAPAGGAAGGDAFAGGGAGGGGGGHPGGGWQHLHRPVPLSQGVIAVGGRWVGGGGAVAGQGLGVDTSPK